jgi:hypothetical protein
MSWNSIQNKHIWGQRRGGRPKNMILKLRERSVKFYCIQVNRDVHLVFGRSLGQLESERKPVRCYSSQHKMNKGKVQPTYQSCNPQLWSSNLTVCFESYLPEPQASLKVQRHPQNSTRVSNDSTHAVSEWKVQIWSATDPKIQGPTAARVSPVSK